MRVKEETRRNTLKRRLRNDHVHSVTGIQKLCKTPAREVRHSRKFPKIENSLCRAISLQQAQFNSIDSKQWRRRNAAGGPWREEPGR